jgi:hypothetical protein
MLMEGRVVRTTILNVNVLHCGIFTWHKLYSQEILRLTYSAAFSKHSMISCCQFSSPNLHVCVDSGQLFE